MIIRIDRDLKVRLLAALQRGEIDTANFPEIANDGKGVQPYKSITAIYNGEAIEFTPDDLDGKDSSQKTR